MQEHNFHIKCKYMLIRLSIIMYEVYLRSTPEYFLSLDKRNWKSLQIDV